MKPEGTWLEKAARRARQDVQTRQTKKPLALLRTLALAAPKPPSFEQTLRRAPAPRVVAELTRQTPWGGFLDRSLDLTVAAREAVAGGSPVLSIRTEPIAFGGSMDDLTRARQGARTTPLLRRDVIIDAYQLVESRASGVSAVTVPVALHAGAALGALLRTASELGLEAACEVYDEAELDRALDAGAAIVVIEHREPGVSAADLGRSEQLAPRAHRAGTLVLASGGIASAEDVRRLQAAGVDAVLVAEAFLRAADRERVVGDLRAGG